MEYTTHPLPRYFT